MEGLYFGGNISIHHYEEEDVTKSVFDAPNTTITNLEKLEVESIEVSNVLDMKDHKIVNVSSGTDSKDVVILEHLETVEDKFLSELEKLKTEIKSDFVSIEQEVQDFKSKYDLEYSSTQELMEKNKKYTETEVEKLNDKISSLSSDILSLSTNVSILSEKIDDISMFFFKNKNPKLNKK